MSRVFLAEEVRLGRRVVVKVLPPEMSMGVLSDRFEREIRLAAALQHPHIVPLLSAGSAADVLYYVMPYVEGDSLAARLGRDGPLPVGDVARILRDVLDALAYAHGRGIVHRDIKPDNILLSGRHALVTDFGVAKAVSAAIAGLSGGPLTSMGLALGTPTYMSPEQAAADPQVDHRADLYSIGAVGYEMLAGRPPFNAPTAQAMLAAHVTMVPDPVGRYRPNIPVGLTTLVMSALEKLPADRPQSAELMLGKLDELGAATSVSDPQRNAEAWTSLEGTPSTPRTQRVLALFALATVALTAFAYGVSRIAALPDWVWMAALGCMVAGLPIILQTSRVERRRSAAREAGVHPVPNERLHHRWFTWRRVWYGGIAALCSVALLSGAYAVSRQLGIGPGATLLSAGALAAEDRLVLADFTNRTADSSLGNAVTEALRVDLGQSRAVALLDGRQVSAALKRMSVAPDTTLSEGLARDLAMREGAKAVVVGEISRLGSGYVLTAHIVTADSGATLAPVRATAADEAKLIPAVNALSADLRAKIGESLRTIRATEPLEQVTTASLPALRLYTAGTRAFDAGQYEVSRDLLKRATDIDTAFAMAWRRLAADYYNLNAGYPIQVDAATRAFNHRDRLPPLERYLTEGYYYSSANIRDLNKSIAAYRAAQDYAPGDVTAINNLGLELVRVGQFAAAESLLRAGMVAKPSMSQADNLVDALVAQEKWSGLDTVFRQADSSSPPDHPGRITIRLTAAFAHRDYVRAESLIAGHEPRSGALPLPDIYWSRVKLDMIRGRAARAGRLLRAIRDTSLRSGDRTHAARAAIASAMESGQLGQLADARRQLGDAMAGPAFANLDVDDIPARELGRVHAVLGDADGVRRDRLAFETQRPRMSRSVADSFTWIGLEAEAEHRWRDAAVALTQATAIRDLRHCSPCGAFYAATMWDAAGVADSAIAYYRQGVDRPAISYTLEDATIYPVALRRLGDLYADRGDRRAALDWYGRFIDLWRDADPDLQNVLHDVRERMGKLAGE